jgi:TonB family protein
MGASETAEKERRWLQENAQELFMYLSDPLPADKPTAQQSRKAAVSSADIMRNIEPMSANLRPTFLYREQAKYTEIARINREQGTVILLAVFGANGELQIFRVIRSLPDGLTHKAIEAARKLRFTPATKNGRRVSVWGALEFTFNPY